MPTWLVLVLGGTILLLAALNCLALIRLSRTMAAPRSIAEFLFVLFGFTQCRLWLLLIDVSGYIRERLSSPPGLWELQEEHERPLSTRLRLFLGKRCGLWSSYGAVVIALGCLTIAEVIAILFAWYAGRRYGWHAGVASGTTFSVLLVSVLPSYAWGYRFCHRLEIFCAVFTTGLPRQTSKWREVICTDCLRNVVITNVLVAAVTTGIVWMLWAHLHPLALIAGAAILATGVMAHESIRALRWHRHD